MNSHTPHSIVGIWELEKVETVQDLKTLPETARAGMSIYTGEGRATVYCGTDVMVMSYCGNYEIEGSKLSFQIDSCNYRDREGSTIQRKILRLDEKSLVIEARNEQQNKVAKVTWRKTHSL